MTSGTISLLDQLVFTKGKFNTQALYQARKHLGYVPDKSFFYEYLSVREYLQLAAVLADVPNEGQKNHVEYLLREFKLHRWAERMISTLSTGNRQRLALASAFIISPELLLLDEPMNGLDPSGHRNFLQILENYHKGSIPELEIDKIGTIVISSHNLEDIYRICTNIIVFNIYGEIVTTGSVPEIKNRFNTDTTLEEIYLEILDENEAQPEYMIKPEVHDERLP